ncbi:HAMP domain-containing sensor histidine kinase [Brachybacterium horti]
MRRRPLTLRARLLALLAATVAVVCLAIGVIAHVSVRGQLYDELDGQLERAASRALVREGVVTTPQDGPDPSGLPSAPTGGDPGSGEYELTVALKDGEVTSATWRDQSGDLKDLGAEDLATLRTALADLDPAPIGSTGHDGRTTVTLSIGTYRVLLTDGGSGAGGSDDGGAGTGGSGAGADATAIATGLPVDPVRETLLRLDLTLLIATLAALAAAGIGGSALVRRTLRPLDGVARLAGDVARTPLDRGSVTLTERVPERYAVPGTEVGEVGRALNHLLDNVEGAIDTRHRSEERMRRFVADASHELRTPLTAIRGYTQMLRLTEDLTEQGGRSVDRLDAQSARMTSLVEDLLLLARLEEDAPRQHEEVDLGEIALESVMDARATAREHRVDVHVPDAPVTVRGDARQLTQVIVNLLSNARKHTPAGTHVSVRLRVEGERAVLEVEDDGPGIDPEILPDVFSRFTRADRARSGSENTTGLGLSIVRAIAEAHGGTVEVASRPGRTVFTLSLPLGAG